MPFNYSWTDKRFYCKFSGVVTWEDFYAATGILHGSSNLDILEEVLMVFSQEALIKITSMNTRELAYLDKAASRYNSQLNFAFVAPHPNAKNITKNYINFSKEIGAKWNYSVFDNVDSALRWFNSDYNKARTGLLVSKKF